MTDLIADLLQRQASELLGASASGIAEELKTAEDGKLSVGVGFKLTLIGQRVYVGTAIQYSRKFKDETEGMVEIPDPMQPGLPLESGTGISLEVGGSEPITMTDKQFSKIAKEVSKAVKKAAAA